MVMVKEELEAVELKRRLLSEEEVEIKIHEIWRGQNGNCTRKCPNCKKAGLAKYCYPSSYEGDCGRCGGSLTSPSTPF